MVHTKEREFLKLLFGKHFNVRRGAGRDLKIKNSLIYAQLTNTEAQRRTEQNPNIMDAFRRKRFLTNTQATQKGL